MSAQATSLSLVLKPLCDCRLTTDMWQVFIDTEVNVSDHTLDPQILNERF